MNLPPSCVSTYESAALVFMSVHMNLPPSCVSTHESAALVCQYTWNESASLVSKFWLVDCFAASRQLILINVSMSYPSDFRAVLPPQEFIRIQRWSLGMCRIQLFVKMPIWNHENIVSGISHSAGIIVNPALLIKKALLDCKVFKNCRPVSNLMYIFIKTHETRGCGSFE